jgi:aminoglycoside phosphotransferase (APT) family kinase protein
MPTKMHADEFEIDTALVRQLLRAQQPQWADLPLARVRSSGTDNAIFRLGRDMAVRIPRIHWAVDAIEKERRWLPVLAPDLPLAVSVPLAEGEPGEGYPWPWSVYSWLDGDDAFDCPPSDLSQAAKDVAGFVFALRAIDPTGGPTPRPGNRGTSLLSLDEPMREVITAAADLIDARAVTATWRRALRAPEWDRPPVWFHGDIASGNLLVQGGRIRAVIDFGVLGVGDPACDLIVAWEMFDADSRQTLRAELDVDDASWGRGRGWALSTAMFALPYYLHTNPVMVAQARRKIAAVLDG